MWIMFSTVQIWPSDVFFLSCPDVTWFTLVDCCKIICVDAVYLLVRGYKGGINPSRKVSPERCWVLFRSQIAFTYDTIPLLRCSWMCCGRLPFLLHLSVPRSSRRHAYVEVRNEETHTVHMCDRIFPITVKINRVTCKVITFHPNYVDS